MNGPRRLPLSGSAPRLASGRPQLSPAHVSVGAIAIAECVEHAGAYDFVRLLAETLRARRQLPFIAFCAFDSEPSLTAAQVAGLSAIAPSPLTVRIAGQAELQQLVDESERLAPSMPRLFVGDPALVCLDGALKVVIDREGVPASLTPRAQGLRAAAHLVLSAPRAGVARSLADGWPWLTSAP